MPYRSLYVNHRILTALTENATTDGLMAQFIGRVIDPTTVYI